MEGAIGSLRAALEDALTTGPLLVTAVVSLT